jgi:hypothetical protein
MPWGIVGGLLALLCWLLVPFAEALLPQYSRLTVTSGAVVGLTLTAGDIPLYAFITVDTAPVCLRYDGGNPTSAAGLCTSGHTLEPDAPMTLPGVGNIRRLRFIAATTTNASVNVTLTEDR